MTTARTVLMTTDAVGGVWSYSLELADALTAHDVDVALAVLGPAPSVDQRAELAASGVAAAYDVPGALEWMPEPWADVDRAGATLLDLHERVGADIVHLNGYAHAALPWTAPAVVVAHSDVLTWWRAVHGQPAPATWATYADRVGAGLRAAAGIVAPTRAMLEALRREHRFDGGTVIPNGRRDHWAGPTAKEPLVVAAGRAWDPAKNLDVLAHAAGSLDWPVVVIGAGTAPPSPSPAPPWRALGPLPFDGVAEWLGRATIFAAPSVYEPFGLAALEAGLAGCALVLGDIPTLREVWDDAATFVDPRDGAALTRTLQGLGADPARCAELGARPHARALRYRPATMAAAYASLYRSLVRVGCA